jgi:RHS repeat-associated protein
MEARVTSSVVRLARLTVTGTSAVVLGVALWGAPVFAAAHHRHKWHPPKPQRVKVLPRIPAKLTRHGWKLRRVPEGTRGHAIWPAPGFGVSALGTAHLTSVGRLPVLAARANGPTGAGLTGARVQVYGRPAIARLGLSGVLFTVSSDGTGGGLAAIGLNYSRFADAIGGNFADRLHLVQLPRCALTDPKAARCRAETPVDTAVHAGQHVLSGRVWLGSAGRVGSMAGPRLVVPQAGQSVVMAAVSGASGSNGDFTASSLSPAGTWAGGGSSGDFTWSYPITLPKPAAGQAPQVALDYASSSVDGRIASTNNQFGMIGEGFSLSSDNYIERTYADCADDPEGTISSKYDNCWAGQVMTMSLDGKSTPLVLDDSSGKWYEQNDSGDRVQFLTGNSTDTNNGTYDNGYWVVTTPDGTQYFFGKNRGPGWASGDSQTNSVYTEPVYGAHSGDPCYSSSGFSSSSCTQAWRWNLDFVVDPNGNAMAYYYNRETNYYGANNATTGVQYVRAGYLSRIDYGLRDENGSIYGTANAPDQVVFGADQRCIPTSTFNCAASSFTSANASNWPDVPFDQQCLSGASCSNHSPTFWSQMRIDSITTQYWNGTKYVPVDSYALGQGFSTQGDPELILNSITKTGHSASGSTLSLPAVQLSYQLMDNRIPGYNSLPGMAHWRLTQIETETGELISVTYSTGCSLSDIPSDPSTNTTLCYPVKWAQQGDQNTTLDYFNKYVVKKVEVQDGTAGDPNQLTTYNYIGNPAWHFDDNEVVKAKDRTWGQFRGYAQVNTLAGDPTNATNGSPDVQTVTEARYYQGMNGDTNSSGGTTSGVTVADSASKTYTDANALAGQPLETQTFNGSTELTDTVTVPSVLSTVATRARTGLPAQQAIIVGVTKQIAYTDLAGGGQQQKTTVTSYDSSGRPVLSDQSGTSVPETCTQTSYADNNGAWIHGAASEVITAAQACPSSPGNLTASDILTDTRTYYDGSTTLGAAPTAGNPTQVTQATDNNNGTLTFVTQKTMTYDSSGRVLTTTDGNGHPTTKAYTPADGGPLTQEVTTNALGQAITQVFDPGRGTVLSLTDAAGYQTTAAYDALGRLTAVWKPGRSQANNDAANATYSYFVSQTKPLAVTTNKLVDYGTGTNYVTSISLYDSLGQLRQTQTAAEGGNSIVTDQFRDSHGWAWQSNNKYVVSGSPSTTLVNEPNSAINDRVVSTFDGAGRVVSDQYYNGNTLTKSVQTVYGGNQVTSITRAPLGNVVGTPSATVTNVLGQQTEQIQYAGTPTVSGSVVSGGSPQVTTVSYNASGDKTSIKDPAGNTWNYSYDLLGRQIKTVDPDAGTIVTGYDAANNVTYTTNGAGVSDNYVYDALNRKTAEYTGSTTPGSGTLAATWVFDTLKKGLLSFETSVNNGVTYKTGVIGYDSEANVSGNYVSVPTGQPLAGTYRTQYSYSTTGLMLAETPAAGGGLPVDSLTYTYDQFGNSTSEKGFDVYVSGAVWTPYNEISQIELGSGPSSAALTYSYDPQTRNVTGLNLSDQQPQPQADNIAYTYNADQQVTQVADTQGGGTGAPVEDQCFNYDSLSRLSEAWTSSNACASDPASAGNSTVNGPEPYWQSWTFDPLGDILTMTSHATAGSASGDTTSTYSYSTAGHAHAVSSISTANTVTGNQGTTSYGYNGAGQTTTLGSQSMTWTPNGSLATAGTASAPASYAYDADGNQLVENDNGTATLYLPGEQLTASGGTTSGIRYYSFAGKTIGETTSSTLYWLNGNDQGSMTTAVAAFSESTVIYRGMTPYGTVLNGTGIWPDNRGLLGDPNPSATGLLEIGARKFNPATGLFVSVDPNLDVSHPQTMTGYTYADDSPVTNEDPTGLMFIDCGGGGGYVPPYHAPPVSHPDYAAYTDWGVRIAYLGYGIRPLYLPRYQDAASSWSDSQSRLSRLYNGGDRAALTAAGVDEEGLRQYYNNSVNEFLARSESDAKYFRGGFMTSNWFGGAFSVVGGAVSGWGEWQRSAAENHGHGSWTKTVAVAAADTAINLGAMVGTDMATGALIGSCLGPGVGTAIGVGVGLLAAGVTYVAERWVNDRIDAWSGAVTSNVSKAADTVGHAVANVAKSAWNSITSWF